MASVASKLIEEVTAHAQSDSLEDARELCADGTYFPNNLRRNVSDKSCRKKIKPHVSCSIPLLQNRADYEIMRKILGHPDRPDVNVGACALRGGYLWLQTNTHNMQYLLLFYRNNGYPQHHEQYSARIVTSFSRNICKPSWQMCGQLRPKAARLII